MKEEVLDGDERPVSNLITAAAAATAVSTVMLMLPHVFETFFQLLIWPLVL